MNSQMKRKLAFFIVLVAPALLLFAYFVAIPFFKTFYYSLTNWNGLSPNAQLIGFKNFVKLYKDNKAWISLWNNTKYFLFGGILTFGIAIFNAVTITQSKLHEKKFYRILFFFPNILSIVIISLLWMFIYNPNWGILNETFRFLGLDHLTQTWLGNKKTVTNALIVPWVWMSVGFYMVLFMSTIESIPSSLFEAAEIDGASSWQRFSYITFPLLKETNKTALVFFFINAFSGVFTLVNVMTDGSPAGASEVLTNHMYRQAFQANNFGYATAIGVFVFFLIIVLSSIMLALTRTKDIIEF